MSTRREIRAIVRGAAKARPAAALMASTALLDGLLLLIRP
jgi:hypothetical protein